MPTIEPDYVIAARELQTATADMLARHGLKAEVVCLGERTAADGWKHDAHSLRLTGQRVEFFPYRTGTGLRVPRKPTFNGALLPKAPPKVTPGEILGCIARDAFGPYVDRESFDSWCSDHGFDTDSREAEAMFDACREGGEKMSALGFTIADIAILAEIAGRL